MFKVYHDYKGFPDEFSVDENWPDLDALLG